MDINIFISYATIDSKIFRLTKLANNLNTYREIKSVLYWQEDMYGNMIKYMNNNINNCDILLLLCSPNALNSEVVLKEWSAADAMGKPIIPIFLKIEHIPPFLRSRRGIEFDPFNFGKCIEEIYNLIVKTHKLHKSRKNNEYTIKSTENNKVINDSNDTIPETQQNDGKRLKSAETIY